MKNKNIFILTIILLLAVFLRFYKLGQNPVSLYWDEAAIGVDALSIAQTGKDQYASPWLRPIIASYGDYKAPLYICLSALAVKLFGLSEFSVRFTSAFFGSLTVLLVYFLTNELIKKEFKIGNWKLKIGLIASLILAVSPWHFHFSRIGFESNLSLFWVVWSLYFLLKGLRKGYFLLLTALTGAVSVYSYFSARVILPMLLLVTMIFFVKKVWQKKLWVISAIFLFIILLLPLFRSALYPLSQQIRMSTKNILTNSDLVVYSSKLIEVDQGSFWGRKFHHRYYYLVKEFLVNYMSHFSPQFLFLKGDSNLRHHSGFGGQLYLAWLPLLLLGFYALFKKINKNFLLLFTWLLLAPLTAAVPYEVPHASRAIYMVLPLVMVLSLGFNQLIIILKNMAKTKRRLVLFTYLLIFTLNMLVYLHDYQLHYPLRSCQVWQDGYKQLMLFLKEKQEQYDVFYISEKYRLPFLYYVFYFQPDISELQQLQRQRLDQNPQAFGDLKQIGKFKFNLQIHQSKANQENFMVAVAPGERAEGTVAAGHIKFSNGQPAFYLFVNPVYIFENADYN